VATFTLLIVGSGTVIFGYARVHESLAERQTAEELTRNLATQVDALIPSFLLPEQKDGTNLILERIKAKEELSGIAIIDKSPPLSRGQNCSSEREVRICDTGSEISIAAPIQESGKVYGFLVKTKQATHVASADLLRTFLFTSSLLFVGFFVFFLMLARLLRQIPSDIDSLVIWIDDDLSGNHRDKPKFTVGELDDLSGRISEVIERHDRARDQAVVGQLTSGIMHDIRTPLASLVAATCLVQEQSKDSPKRQSRLENLFSVCEARLPIIGEIIESTLDGSREVHIEKASQSLSHTIRSSIALTSELVQGRRAELTFEEPVPEVSTPHDSVQIGRVLTNLIKNGLEAAQVSQPKLHITIERTAVDTKITVEDNGPGISGQVDKVFRIFRSTKSHGSGLGLLVSKKIVEAHNGKLGAGRSQRLGGARFEISLPNSEAAL
jgi:signal transduction histidine kinase